MHTGRLCLVPRHSADAVEASEMRHVEMQIRCAIHARVFLAASRAKRVPMVYVQAQGINVTVVFETFGRADASMRLRVHAQMMQRIQQADGTCYEG